MQEWKKFPKFKMFSDGKIMKFKLGLNFTFKVIRTNVVHNYGLYQTKPIWIDKDDNKRFVLGCKV